MMMNVVRPFTSSPINRSSDAETLKRAEVCTVAADNLLFTTFSTRFRAFDRSLFLIQESNPFAVFVLFDY